MAKTREAIDRVAKGLKVEANSANVETLISLHHHVVLLAAEAVAAVAYQVRDGALQPLESYVPPPLPFMRPSPLTKGRLRFAEQQARASSRSLVSDSVLSLSLEFGMADAFSKECVAFVETIGGQLRAATVSRPKSKPRQRHSPGTAEAHAGRPIPVLAVMNYSSQAIARAMIERVASHLKADVIHLDTHTLAHITGGVLGQDLYSHKGPFSMMGYRVDELSGRLTPRITPQPETTSSPDSSDPQSNAEAGNAEAGSGGGLYTVSSNQLRTMLLGSEQAASSPARVADWDDLKLGHALEQILNAADVKRAPLPESEFPGPPDGGPRRLIVHVHDIAELTELGEGSLILSKLRTAVDRLADGGKPIILIGSTTHVLNKAWYKQLSNLVDSVNCHIHPFDCPPPRHPKDAKLLGSRAVGHRNLSNLTSMLEAMLGQEVSIPLGVMASKVLEYLDQECLE